MINRQTKAFATLQYLEPYLEHRGRSQLQKWTYISSYSYSYLGSQDSNTEEEVDYKDELISMAIISQMVECTNFLLRHYNSTSAQNLWSVRRWIPIGNFLFSENANFQSFKTHEPSYSSAR